MQLRTWDGEIDQVHHFVSLRGDDLDGTDLYLIAPEYQGGTGMSTTLPRFLAKMREIKDGPPLAVVSTGVCAGYREEEKEAGKKSDESLGDVCVAKRGFNSQEAGEKTREDANAHNRAATQEAMGIDLWQSIWTEPKRYKTMEPFVDIDKPRRDGNRDWLPKVRGSASTLPSRILLTPKVTCGP